VLDLDDEDALETAFSREGEQIAAVIVEPLPANHGLLVQRLEFLETLRDVTTRHGALLIFDEVISGFRLGPDGAAGRYEVTPDLVTFGKVIGGGLPVGAFAGRRELMDELAPLGPVYQAGTLSGNPVAMAAGLSTLRVLEARDGWRQLEAMGQVLEARVGPVLQASPLPIQLVREGSIFWLCAQAGPPPRSPREFDPEGANRYRKIFHALIERDIYLAPSAFEVGFLSLAHQERHVDELAASLEEALAEAMSNV
jgi:glutamate-1-semialdehyde 2,1-aminomutase